MTKYRNIKTTYNGIKFDSKKEANYCFELDMRKKAGEVISYEMQVPFQVVLNEKKICKYILDFMVLLKDGSIEYVDVKGMKTTVYRIKKKLVEAQFNLKIKEV